MELAPASDMAICAPVIALRCTLAGSICNFRKVKRNAATKNEQLPKRRVIVVIDL